MSESPASTGAADVWPLDPTNVKTGLPLEGVRILDMSRVLAGPFAAMVLADLGADVIKVESPEGDPVRQLAPPHFGADATYYLAVNRGRRNVVCDLRRPDHVAQLGRIMDAADAVVENYLPSQRRSLGLEAMRDARPELVWVTIAPAGPGPLADVPAFDLLAQARSGLMSVTGDTKPTKVGAPVGDVIAGLYAAIALVTGLFARASGRPGRSFEAPLLESTISSMVNQIQGYLATGVPPERRGNDHPSITPYGPVKTHDGSLLLAVGTDSQYARLAGVLGDPWFSSPALATNPGRIAARHELAARLGEVFAERTSLEWSEVLTAAAVPHAPILDVASALAQPQVRQGDLLGEMETAHGPLPVVRSPLRVDGRRPPLRRGPRQKGEDSAALGFSE